MLRALLVFACIALQGLACKTRQDQSQVKDLEDTSQINYVPSENKFFVICREGRWHQGQKNALVTHAQLKDVCEETSAPAGGVAISPIGGSSGPDLASCQNVPAKVKALNLAFSPGFIASTSTIAPALAKQQLCVGVVTGLKSLVESSEPFYKFLMGETGGGQILIIIDVKDALVTYDQEFFTLTLPSKITEQTKAEIEAKLDALGISFTPCADPGKPLFAACWFFGQGGTNCTSVCTTQGRKYDEKTRTIAGSDGTLALCRQVGALFSAQQGNDTNCGNGLNGCFVENNVTSRCTAPATDPNLVPSFGASYRLLCACK